MRCSKTTFYIHLLAVLLAYSVIVLGAYTRLSDAGLGCPDWPGCYGKIFVPEDTGVVEQANKAYPERPVQQAKAWKEMVHRYAAGTLGLLILLLVVRSWVMRARDKAVPVVAPSALLLLVVLQAALGMWTVTLLLKPVVVTAHLLGGMAIVAILCWLMLNASRPISEGRGSAFTPWVAAALLVLYCQIALGGWVSANYSALICADFPTCQGQWWPDMDFREAFVLWRGLGVDYEGGVLDAAARTAVQVSHRMGALFTFIVLLSLGLSAILANNRILRRAGLAVILILFIQVSLGVANVLMVLPLAVAVAHNAVAALLMLAMVSMLYFSFFSSGQGKQ